MYVVRSLSINPLDWGYGSDGDDDNDKYVNVDEDFDED